MKLFTFIIAASLVCSCNTDDDRKHDKDSASKFDSIVEKVDTTLEQWGDSAKEKYKDIKQDVNERQVEKGFFCRKLNRTVYSAWLPFIHKAASLTKFLEILFGLRFFALYFCATNQ